MKRVISLLIAVLLIALMIPWASAAEYDYISDATDQMDHGAMMLLSQSMRSIDDNSGVRVRAEIVSDYEEASLQEHCDQLLDSFGDENSILAVLQLTDQGGDLQFGGYAWSMKGYWATEADVAPLMDALSSWFNADSFSQVIEIDREACIYGMNFYVGAIGSLIDANGVKPADGSLILSPDGVSGTYILDGAGLLTADQRATLEAQSAVITSQFPINVYVVTVDDYRSINSDSVFEAAEQYYLSHGLGYGPNQDGMLLLLSMADRDYSLIAYGDYALTNLTDYGRQQLSKEFLDDFRDDDWMGGFEDYLRVTQDYLTIAEKERPVDIYPKDPPDPKKVRGLGAVLSLIMGFPASLLACTGMKAKMRSVKAAHAANQYLNPGSVNFSDRSEVLTNTTQVRTPIPRQEHRDSGGGSGFGGGGSHVNSSGFGGHSGKF